jgi:hypothetical protein
LTPSSFLSSSSWHLIAVVLLVAGCGGGSSTSTGAGASIFTQGSVNCTAVAGPEPISNSFASVMGSCNQYEASSFPTRSSTAFKSPGFNFPVALNQVTGYNIVLPLLVPGSTNVSLASTLTLPGGAVAASFGNFGGRSFQTIFDADTGGNAVVHDFRNTVTDAGQKFLDLNFSRFGLFSRFESRSLGYYGGWFQGDNLGSVPASQALFRGVVVGVLGPSSVNTASVTTVGYSADIEFQVNFAVPSAPITSLSITNFSFTFDGKKITTPFLSPGGAVSSSSLEVGSKSVSASFTTGIVGAPGAIAEGTIAGSFQGGAGVNVTEFVGTVKFRTQDGRNAVGAFGSRIPVANSIVNP